MAIRPFDGAGRSILVIDDDVAIRVLLQAVLKRMNFEVHLAEDGEAGLQKLKDRSFQVVLLDLMMPRVNGYEFLARLDEENHFPRPHIIVFTAAGQRGVDKLPPDSVCSSVLKPFDLEAFLSLVKNCMDGHEHQSSEASTRSGE